MQTPSVLFGTQAQEIYRDMFCQLYNQASPHVPLGSLLHWKHRIAHWKLTHQHLHQEIAYIPKGYFYSIHTPMLSSLEIEETLANPAPVLLIPYLREGTSSSTKQATELEKLGFQKLPWCYEAVYQIHQDINADLRAQLGKDRYKRIKSLARKAEAEYDFVVYDGQAATSPEVIQTFAQLHQHNAEKYRHGLNTYAGPILEKLADSPLGNHLVIDIYKEKKTGRIVQSSISLMCLESEEMILLAQGIDHGHVPPTQNLYVAETYSLYQWAFQRGIRRFNLGRDAPLVKRTLGANQFFLLENYLLAKNPEVASDIKEIKKLAQERSQEEQRLIMEKGFKRVTEKEMDSLILP